MSNRRDLQQRLQRLEETRGILNAMKNLALMETRKLARRRDTQQQVVDLVESVAADFLGSYPIFPPVGLHTANIFLLIGSERGFCGDFNEAIVAALASELPSPNIMPAHLIAVGHKLCSRLADDPRVIAALDGANVADEVPNVLNRLIETTSALPAQEAALTVFYHSLDAGEVVKERLLPPFQRLLETAPPETAPPCPYPPLLNLPPPVFLGELIDQYLFAVLHQAFYTSLLAESHRRVSHMDGAVSHLDKTIEALTRKGQSLRQEEITEEIEVILLSAEGLNQP